MKHRILIVVIISFISCGQDLNNSIANTPSPNDSIIYDFIRFVLKDSSSNYRSISGAIDNKLRILDFSNIDSTSIVGMDTLFSKEEIKYVYKQMNDTHALKLTTQFFPGFDFIPFETLVKAKLAYFSISKPIFTSDKSIAIIKIDFNCFGTCGDGGTFVYKKQGRAWKRVGTLSEWIN